MKKILSLIAAAVITLGAQADDVKYLTFKTADGATKSLSIADGLTIRFAWLPLPLVKSSRPTSAT